MLLHEASIIAPKERAEMKMIEFFIARKIVVDDAWTFNHTAPCAVKRTEAGSSIRNPEVKFLRGTRRRHVARTVHALISQVSASLPSCRLFRHTSLYGGRNRLHVAV